MNIQELKKRYHPEIVERMLDVLYDTPVHELVEEVLYKTSQQELDKWAKEIQEDFSYSDEVNGR